MLHVPTLAVTAILAVVLRTVAGKPARYARGLFENNCTLGPWRVQAAAFPNAAFFGLVPVNANRVEAAGGC